MAERNGPAAAPAAPADGRSGVPVTEILIGLLLVAILARDVLEPLFDGPRVQTWFTVFIAITVEAMPFLVLGVVIAAAITAFVPPDALARTLPKSPVSGVPVAGLAGLALPGSESGSVPSAARLMGRGVPAAVALTFLLAAPAVNPIVIAATLVAFPGQPELAGARFAASFVTAVVVGFVWARFGRDQWIARARWRSTQTASRWHVFRATTAHGVVDAGSFLVVGAATAAVLQVFVPQSILDSVGGSGILAVLTMALLAVALAVCSEADAFVVAGLTQFSLTSRLVFLVVGPVVDVKLIASQAGTFGRSFVLRFAPLAFAVAVTVSVLFGWWLL